MSTPDVYPKPTPEQVEAHMAEVRAALAAARERAQIAKKLAAKAGTTGGAHG